MVLGANRLKEVVRAISPLTPVGLGAIPRRLRRRPPARAGRANARPMTGLRPDFVAPARGRHWPQVFITPPTASARPAPARLVSHQANAPLGSLHAHASTKPAPNRARVGLSNAASQPAATSRFRSAHFFNTWLPSVSPDSPGVPDANSIARTGSILAHSPPIVSKTIREA